MESDIFDFVFGYKGKLEILAPNDRPRLERVGSVTDFFNSSSRINIFIETQFSKITPIFRWQSLDYIYELCSMIKELKYERIRLALTKFLNTTKFNFKFIILNLVKSWIHKNFVSRIYQKRVSIICSNQ